MTTRKIHKPWVKLHIRILYNADIGELPDSSKWRFIECLLLAGEERNRAAEEGRDIEEGFLPSLKQMAYTLRTTIAALQDDLSRLSMAGLLELRAHPSGEDRWFVTNFEKWQTGEKSNPSEAERQRYSRARRKNEEKEEEERGRIIVDTKSSHSSHKSVTRKTPPSPELLAIGAISDAITEVTGISARLNKQDMYECAADLYETGYTPEQIRDHYGAARVAGKWNWYEKDWRGRDKGDKPRLKEIRETIAGAVAHVPAQSAQQDPAAADSLWHRTLQAITAGRVDDERLKVALKAIGGSSAIKQANEYSTPKLKDRLFNEYQRTLTAA